jgi:hypothetical protein
VHLVTSAVAGARSTLLSRYTSTSAWLALGLVVGSGCVARFWKIDALGLNSDEAVYSGQAAAIAAVADLEPFFRIFRAHPLLFQTLLSLGWRLDLGEPFGRLLSAVFGLGTVVVTYHLGRLLYGRRAGIVAAAFLVVMPYHVIVSRQVLLDVPMTFFATTSLYCLARFVAGSRPLWLYSASAFLGLAFLSKETTLLLYGAVYAFLVLSADVRLRARSLLVGSAILVTTMAAFPLALALSGGGPTGRNYLAWQLLRRPNHSWSFYFVEVPKALGPAVVALAILSLPLLWRERSWRERLLLCWILVPFLFFELWPVKGFQYLLSIAPAVAVLAARVLVRWPELHLARHRHWLSPACAAAVGVTMVVPSWGGVQPVTKSHRLAGSGGVPGGREAGRWMAAHTPRGSSFFAIGPSMANIIEFYGLRRGFGLSVSPNPLARNPAYEPVRNPDLLLRRGIVRYLVWDAFSAQRSPFFERKLLRYVDRYEGRVVHTEAVAVETRAGAVRKPVVVVYAVGHGRTGQLGSTSSAAASEQRARHVRRLVIYLLYLAPLVAAAVLLARALREDRRLRADALSDET